MPEPTHSVQEDVTLVQAIIRMTVGWERAYEKLFIDKYGYVIKTIVLRFGIEALGLDRWEDFYGILFLHMIGAPKGNGLIPANWEPWKPLKTWDSAREFEPWLRKVVRNKCNKIIKGDGPKTSEMDDDTRDPGAGPEETLETADPEEMRRKIPDPRDRQIAALVRWPDEDVARALMVQRPTDDQICSRLGLTPEKLASKKKLTQGEIAKLLDPPVSRKLVNETVKRLGGLFRSGTSTRS